MNAIECIHQIKLEPNKINLDEDISDKKCYICHKRPMFYFDLINENDLSKKINLEGRIYVCTNHKKFDIFCSNFKIPFILAPCELIIGKESCIEFKKK